MALNKVTTFQSQVRANSTSETPVVKSTRITDNQVVRIANIPLSDNNITVRKTTNSNEFYASKLLNYVESVNISGFPKTVFYSELATNFNIGDRVYILNGFYDSADFISKDKYTKFTDGYRVLGVDGCRIILDLDYTGQLPYTDFKLEDLIFVHHITSQAQFDYVNSLRMAVQQKVSEGGVLDIYSMFYGERSDRSATLYGRNIIYVSQEFLASSDFLNESGGVSSPGFYVKDSSNIWNSVDNPFDFGNFVDGNYDTDPNNEFISNRIVIIGEDFTYSGNDYRERQVYKFDRTKADTKIQKTGEWVFDKEYKQPIISKLNFRYGKFKGVHNDGIFGSYDKVPNWSDATWNSGFFVNSTWNLGIMSNKSKTEKSYSSKLTIKTGTTQSVAIQNVDFSNNRGFGYNYVIDSTIKEATISKGNFENSNIGLTLSISVLNNYYNSISTYSVTGDFVNYNFCNVYTNYLSNALVSDSILENSVVFKSKLVNNQIIDSVVDSTQYNSDGGISVIGADIWGYDTKPLDKLDFTSIRGILKLYISDKDFLRLEKGDSFYLERINKEYYVNNLTTNEKIQLPIETRYILDYYTDYELYEANGISSKVIVSLKPKINNYLRYYVSGVNSTENLRYEEPNTDGIPNRTVVGGDGAEALYIYYWELKHYYEWREDRKFNTDEFVLYNGRLYEWSGATDSNTEPTYPPPEIDDFAWNYISGTPSQWDSRVTNNGGQYVFAKTSTGETYSLFFCITTTDNGLGRVIGNSIKISTISTTVLTKSQSYDDNPIKYSSIDIESDSFAWYLSPEGVKTYTSDVINNKSGLSRIPTDYIERSFVNTYLKASDFRSGVFKNSTWLSGYNTNYYGNIIKKNIDKLEISYSNTSNTLTVTLNSYPHNDYQTIKGLDIKKGDSVWLNGVSYTGTSSEVSISGRYTVVREPNLTTSLDIIIKPEFTTASFSSLSKTYSVVGAEGNTYTTLSKFSIEDSTINYGFFKRTQIKNTLISNDQFDNQDTEFKLNNINLLRLVNLLSKDNNLTINDGIFYRSHFVNGNFNLGIVHNSVWNGNTFSNGLFSGGSWQSGNFVSGKFIDSNDTESKSDYHHDKKIYKNWSGGTFQTGEFMNSVWLNGTFNNGRFYNSHFYGGIWNNGILGSKNLSMVNTSFGHYPKLDGIGNSQSIWNYGVVENAIMGGDGIVYWYGGKFNSGEFTSNGATSDNESIWYNGEFNGSKITKLARWKNGIFNSGKFWSYYGWENVGPTSSSNNPSDYSWENGKFKSGEFGYKGLTSNSVWYNGQFYGGQFVGRFWKNGYFLSGDFFGSGPTSGINSASSSLDEYNFADSYTFSYYGLWNDGYVVENIKSISGEEGVLLNQKRAVQIGSKPDDKTKFNNILWLGGTFSHNNAVINDSLWLYGSFVKGDFNGGVFNPYVDRDFTGSFSNSSFGSTSYWDGGNFLTGSFWSADWARGTFKNGYISGARWYNGTFEYGTAENIYWLNGTWKNGNWNGSPYDYTYITTTVSNNVSVSYMIPGRENDVIFKVSSYNDLTNTDSGATQANIHVMNIFSTSNSITIFSDNIDESTNWYQTPEVYSGQLRTGGTPLKPILTPTILNRSTWDIETGLYIVESTEKLSGSNGIKPFLVNSLDSNLVTTGGDNSYYANLGLAGYNQYTQTDVPPSSKLFATYSGSTDIFNQQPYNYTIKLTVAVELSPTVEVECFVGGLSSSIFQLNSDSYKWSEEPQSRSRIITPIPNPVVVNYDYYAKIYTITLSYNTSPTLISQINGQKFAIRKNSNGILRILKAEIKRGVVEYHPTLNNVLYPGVNLLTKKVEFPATSSISLNTVSSNGYEIGTNFGNGAFKSGVWENGVWNNGYRSSDWFGDSDIIKASDVVSKKTYKISKNTWLVTIKCYEILDNFNINYKISVGNIVSIDINGKRNFMRDPMRVNKVDTDNSEMSFLYVSNFEIREIKKDSPNHLIYITQNIWQNGVFLNGYFNGVWSNGVFKGYPKTTEMVDSHVVNGYFDGGHFKSITLVENINEGLPEYNTGLIQNITFKDRNVASGTYSSYESWMDVGYFTNSNVNLNIYARNIGVSGKTSRVVETYNTNLYGPPTFDVMSSDSYFRNSKTSAIRRYALGSKYQIYSDLLQNYGDFKVPYLSTENYTPIKGSKQDSIVRSLKKSDFFSQGWTYSYVSKYEIDKSAQDEENYGNSVVYTVSSNTNADNNGRLNIQLERFQKMYDLNTKKEVTSYSATNSDVVTFTIKNTKVVTKPDRYYFIDLNMNSLPSTQSIIIMSDNSQLTDESTFVHNPSQSDDGIVYPKRFTEYFYNIPGLDLIFTDTRGPGATYSIEKINFYETDSIPFFKYYETNEIDFSIKNPYTGIAPVIDYTNKNFDFIGNVELGIDYRTIVQQNSFSANKNGSALVAQYVRISPTNQN